MEEYRFIHLLYVPTMACNMECSYCYLEDLTVEEALPYRPLETLQFAIDKMRAQGVIPFNISLHGGEVTTLSTTDFEELIAYIDRYYQENRELLTENGFTVGRPHIKTNLFDIAKHMDTIKKYQVSISGSLDLPFRKHEEYRVTKGGKKTLDTILANIELMRDLPNKKKVSATIFKEHFDALDECVEDIWYLHRNTCLDMNDFNFMIGFAYNSNGLLTPMTQEEQVQLYRKMHECFDGTELDRGVNGAWFNEFGPEYCTNCDNCGEKFLLLERSGDIYSCVRGQKQPDFYYGNIYRQSVEEILNTAKTKMFANHNRMGFAKECGECEYLYICKTGCPFVKNAYGENKSYTCLLQKELYKDRNYEKCQDCRHYAYDYTKKMQPQVMSEYVPVASEPVYTGPTLNELIANDSKLRYIYAPEVFYLQVDEDVYPLQSQILRLERVVIVITYLSHVTLYMKKSLLSEECDYPNNNSLYMMCLSGDLITYEDEHRTKQEHIFTHQIYQHALESKTEEMAEKNALQDEKPELPAEEYFSIPLERILTEYASQYSQTSPNNLFFTTSALRDYHYTKQKNNAFYHIQAINLPFQNIEFMYIKEESDDAET